MSPREGDVPTVQDGPLVRVVQSPVRDGPRSVRVMCTTFVRPIGGVKQTDSSQPLGRHSPAADLRGRDGDGGVRQIVRELAVDVADRDDCA